jgi:hypothetical protein
MNRAFTLALWIPVFLLALAVPDLRAETWGRPGERLTVLALMAIPTGDYKETEGGAAKLGFGAGMELSLRPGRSRQLFFLPGAYYVHHPVDGKALEAALEDEGGGDVSVDAGGWHHLALLGGLRLLSRVDSGAGLYAQAQAGLSLANLGDMEVRGSSQGTMRSSSGPAVSFAYAVGVGIRDGRFNLGARYLDLGEPEFSVSVRSGSQVSRQRVSQRIATILITAGIDF